jgi:hypothetical protein
MEHIFVNAQTGETTTVPLTSEEIAERNVAAQKAAIDALRFKRNALLASCDWTQLADAPVDKSAWATYRQELRNLPANTTDPLNPVWPIPPT